MHFVHSFWLPVGLLVCGLLVWFYRVFDARQQAALSVFAASHLLQSLTASISPSRRYLKRALLLVGIAMIFLALAQPQWGFRWEEAKRRGSDILFAVDTSRSMLTQDVKPNRITRAKLAVTDLVSKLDGDRVGLIAFAGDAFLQAPLTLDYDAFQQSLDALDVGIIPRGGTDVASAITAAQSAFTTETKNQKVLVLITDGEDLEARGVEVAKEAAKDGLKIYTVGVGSTAGDLIPVPGENGGTDFLKDENGQYVKSRLDEGTLKQIAEATGGFYVALGQHGEGLDEVYRQALAPLPKQELVSRMQRIYTERYQWPLGLGILCLLAEMLIGTRRAIKRRPLPTGPKTVGAVAALVIFTCLTSGTYASPQSAESAYKKGSYDTAEKEYQAAAEAEPKKAELQFNYGTAAYKDGKFTEASDGFQKALASDKLDLQEQAYYNLGNAQYRMGEARQKLEPEETIKSWESAIKSYDSALSLKSDDADAKFNRDLVQRKLDELKKQNQQNQKNQNNQNNQQQNQEQKNQSPNSQNQSGKPQNGQNGQQGAQNNSSQPGQPDKTSGKQSGSQPESPANQHNANASSAAPKQSGDKQGQEEQVVPGRMTKEEAKDLLDSLKGDERVYPIAPETKNPNQTNNSPVKRDW